jgi:hypothetical protein
MTTIATLKAMPYAQAKVKRYPNHIVLVSYATEVAEIVGGVLIVHGLYSMTTRKHISAFVREYCGIDYQTAKRCYTNGLGYDLLTKDYVRLP